MPSKFLRSLQSLELEDRILNCGALIGLVGVFLPWMSGELFGDTQRTSSGFQFYTSFIGLAIALLHLFLLSLTFLPMLGGPLLVRKRSLETARLLIAAEATVLVLVALSVLTKVTFDFSRMEVRFGVYVSLIGSLVALLYAFLKWQEQHRRDVQNFFHHPEDQVARPQREDPGMPPPPPSPPPPPPLEEHHLRP